MTHTEGAWQLHSPTEGDPKTGDGTYCVTGPDGGVLAEIKPKNWHETPDNARLIASAPAMLEAIATAGRIVGQVQDMPRMSADERAYALSRASDALGGTYFKTTGKPLEWWRYEAAIAKAKGQEEEVTT